MTDFSRQMSPEEFSLLKHQIDDEVTRLGWSKERCKVYTQDRYGVRSRHAMTDDQLKHLLNALRNLKVQITSQKSNNRLDRRRRRKRF